MLRRYKYDGDMDMVLGEAAVDYKLWLHRRQGIVLVVYSTLT